MRYDNYYAELEMRVMAHLMETEGLRGVEVSNDFQTGGRVVVLHAITREGCHVETIQRWKKADLFAYFYAARDVAPVEQEVILSTGLSGMRAGSVITDEVAG